MESSTIKSESKSIKARKEGNDLYERKKYFDALLCYNKSLCYANSCLLKSLAFANRSATYFELKLYDMCIENIKLAREQGYPNDKSRTLDNREAKCIDLLGESQDRSLVDYIRKLNDRFKLSYPANPSIPFIVENIELRQDEQKRRGIYATTDLKPGDVIAAEDIYYERRAKRTDYERCIHCSKTNMLSLIPCDYAVSIMFCSEPCKNVFPLVLLKTVSTKDAPSIQESMIGARNTKYIESHTAELETIFDFDFVNVSTDVRELINWKCFNGLRRSTTTVTSSAETDDTSAEFLASGLARCYDFINIEKSCSLLRCHIEFPSKNCIRNSRCVGLFGGLLNHSCDPNIKYIVVDNKLVFLAVKPIRSNEQLFISRGPEFYYSTKEARHAYLNRECRCVACINNYPILEDLPAADLSEVDVASGINDSQGNQEGGFFAGFFAQIDRNWKLVKEIHDQYPTKDACTAIVGNTECFLKLAYLGSYPFDHPMDAGRTLREKLEDAESDALFDEKLEMVLSIL